MGPVSKQPNIMYDIKTLPTLQVWRRLMSFESTANSSKLMTSQPRVAVLLLLATCVRHLVELVASIRRLLRCFGPSLALRCALQSLYLPHVTILSRTTVSNAGRWSRFAGFCTQPRLQWHEQQGSLHVWASDGSDPFQNFILSKIADLNLHLSK